MSILARESLALDGGFTREGWYYLRYSVSAAWHLEHAAMKPCNKGWTERALTSDAVPIS